MFVKQKYAVSLISLQIHVHSDLCPGSVFSLERVFSIWTIADLIRIVFFFFWFKDHLFLYPFTPQFKNNTKIIVLLKSLHMLHF